MPTCRFAERRPGIVTKIFCVEASNASTSSVWRAGSTVNTLIRVIWWAPTPRVVTSHLNPDDSMGFALKRLQQILRSHMDAALCPTPSWHVATSSRRRQMLRILDGLAQSGLGTRTAVPPEQRARKTVLQCLTATLKTVTASRAVSVAVSSSVQSRRWPSSMTLDSWTPARQRP